MHLIFLLLCVILFVPAPKIHAQIPKEMQREMQQGVNDFKKKITELEKQIAEAKASKEDAETIKGMEAQLSMLKQQLQMIQKLSGTVSKVSTRDIQEVIDNNDPDAPKKFPKSNPALLESLPKLSSKAAVTSYVNDLHNQFLKKVNPELITSFKQIETQLEKDILKMEASALAAWYNEAPSQAILLMTKAAANPKASDLILNNLAAVLNMGSLENKSLPILKYLENIYPNNAMVLNNLGQAYTGLGELNSAMMCFGRCIQQEPNHPQANYTAGEIELSRGNTAAATQHFKNSLNGAYTDEADRRVRFVEPDMDIDDYIKQNLHMPEYFNENKYNVPRQCQNVNEAEELWAIYNGYKDMINAVSMKYGEIGAEYAKKAHADMEKRKNDALALKELSQPPFIKKALYAWDALMKKYKSDGEWLGTMNMDYEKRKKEIFESYQARSTSQDCAAQTASINQYLREMADITKAWQLKHTLFNKKYINQLIYWSFLNSFSSNEFKMKFYAFVGNYLSEMKGIARTELWGPPCKQIEQGNTAAAPILIEEPKCPIELELKLIVGKIALNCDKFSFEGGELIRFKYEKNFKSKQSTMELGIGIGLDIGAGFGGFNASASIKAGESVFITFDGNNSISDVGLSMAAKASAGAEMGASKSIGEIVREIGAKQEIGEVKTSVEAKVGVDSGWTFNEGPLKSVLNPAPQQINPNVNIYKGNK
jgi:tetratricopeptide (TPR) repeat protein